MFSPAHMNSRASVVARELNFARVRESSDDGDSEISFISALIHSVVSTLTLLREKSEPSHEYSVSP